MTLFKFNYSFLLLVLSLFSCKTTQTEAIIPNKTNINWSSAPQQPVSYQKTTKELRSNKIPDSVFTMLQLTVLTIIGMDCDYGDHDSCWMIKEIPAQIQRLKKLESLTLNVNAIRTIPAAIKQLQHLRLLDLTDNSGLSDISNVTALSNLQNLFLYGCGLSKLPNDIGQLKNLKVLGLTGNNLNKKELTRIKKELPGCEIIFN